MKGQYIGMGIALVLAASVVLAGCGRSSNTIATVDGVDITAREFNNYLKFKRIPSADKARAAAALEQYLKRRALADVVSKQKLLDQGIIDAELADFRTQMLVSRYFDKYLDEKVTDQAVKNYYDSHPKQFQKKKVHVAHILIRTDRNMSEAERKAKLTTAEEVYSKLKAGADFAKVADKYSEDRISAKKGGDLGWLQQGAIDPRFSKTVFSMKPGEISEPFETAFGFHVVKLIDGPLVVKQPFKTVEGDIRYQLRNQAKQAELKRLLSLTKIEKHQ